MPAVNIGLLTKNEYVDLLKDILNDKFLYGKVEAYPVKGSNGLIKIKFDESLNKSSKLKKLIEKHERHFKLSYSKEDEEENRTMKSWC